MIMNMLLHQPDRTPTFGRMEGMPIRTALVEDEPAVREILVQLLKEEASIALDAVYATAEEAMEELPALAPQVVILDIGLPRASGLECLRAIAPKMPGTQFLIYTMYEDDKRVFDALLAGAHGYILKNGDPERIVAAIQEVAALGAPMSATVARRVLAHFHTRKATDPLIEQLSTRELDVLRLLAEGLLYKEIAQRLGLSTNTVGQHAHRIYGKLHVQNRTEALRKFHGR